MCTSISCRCLRPFTHKTCSTFAAFLLRCSVQKFPLQYGSSNMVYSVPALVHFPEDVLSHDALKRYSCAPYESMMWFLNFGIWGPKTPAQQLHCRICESLTLNYVSTSVFSDDVGEPQKRFRGSRRPFIIRNMALTNTSPNNVVIVAERPASIAGLEKDLVHVNYFTEPLDSSVKLSQSSHFCIFPVSILQADNC